MRNEAHQLAEHLLRFPAQTDAQKWLRAEMVRILKDRAKIAAWSADYVAFLEEESVLNPYLRELTKNYEDSL